MFYFYIIYDPELDKICPRNKLGSTSRPPFYRLKEHKTSYAKYEYYALFRFKSRGEMIFAEYNCLIHTEKWADMDKNECRSGITADKLLQLCMPFLSHGVQVRIEDEMKSRLTSDNEPDLFNYVAYDIYKNRLLNPIKVDSKLLEGEYQSVFNDNRWYQHGCCRAVFKHFQTNNNGLINIGCGCGKTRIMVDILLHYKTDTIGVFMIVLPTLSLIDQFYKEYEGKIKTRSINIINVSSQKGGVSDIIDIKSNITKGVNLIVTTYASAEKIFLVVDCVALAIFDEAHNATSIDANRWITQANISYRLFFTATPVNKQLESYPEIYAYTFPDAVKNRVVQDFNITTGIYTCIADIYCAILQNVILTGNNKILAFHGRINGKGLDIPARQFMDEALLQTIFNSLNSKYKKIRHYCVSGKTKDKERYFDCLDDCPDDEICIISSCKVLSEGINIKNANSCVFITPKTSSIDIMQNVGRVIRFKENKGPSSVIVFTKDLENHNHQLMLDILANIKTDLNKHKRSNSKKSCLNKEKAIQEGEIEQMYKLNTEEVKVFNPIQESKVTIPVRLKEMIEKSKLYVSTKIRDMILKSESKQFGEELIKLPEIAQYFEVKNDKPESMQIAKLKQTKHNLIQWNYQIEHYLNAEKFKCELTQLTELFKNANLFKIESNDILFMEIKDSSIVSNSNEERAEINLIDMDNIEIPKFTTNIVKQRKKVFNTIERQKQRKYDLHRKEFLIQSIIYIAILLIGAYYCLKIDLK